MPSLDGAKRKRAVLRPPRGHRPACGERGNAILQVIVLLSALVVGVYFFSARLTRQKSIVLQTSSVLRVRFALHSVMDYMFYNVQRRFCLDNSLLPEGSCELKSGVSGELGRSLERVLLSSEQATNLRDMLCRNHLEMGLEFPPTGASATLAQIDACLANASPANIQAVRKLDIRMPLARITASHPLYSVLDPMRRALKEELKDDSLVVRVIVERETSNVVPRMGNEVYFSVKAMFEDSHEALLYLNRRTPLQVVSYGTIYPREVGAFALMLPNDLRLDGLATVFDYDNSIPTTTLPLAGRGLVFKSPVFVNQNIVLPFVPKTQGGRGPAGAELKYSPVTFGDRVVLGNGQVMERVRPDALDTPYRVESAGDSSERLWADNKLFGGFRQGVAIDNAYDKGLQVFGGVASGAPVDKTFMLQCIAREKSKSDAEIIRQTNFYGNLQSSGPNSHQYIMGLKIEATGVPSGGSFNPQKTELGAVSQGQFVSATRDSGAVLDAAVIRVRVRMPGYEASAMLPANATLRLGPLVAENASGEKWIDTLNAEKAVIDALPASDPTKTARLAAWQAKKDLHDAAKDGANPKLIEIRTSAVKTVSPLSTGPTDKPQPHLLALDVSFQNPQYFLDGTGQLVSPQIEIQAFDPLWQKGIPVNPSDINPKLLRHLSFQNDSGGMSAPGNFSASTGAPPLTGADAPFSDVAAPLPRYDSTDYLDLDRRCDEARNAATGQSFGAASWQISFHGSTRSSWNFAGDDWSSSGYNADAGTNPYLIDTLALNAGSNKRENRVWFDTATNAISTSGRSPFRPYSIVHRCEIQPGAELVSGFFVCDELYIARRSQPLQIIGTFIVKKLSLGDSSADALAILRAGITWMSIYHPEAPALLRKAGVLHRMSHPAAGDLDACDDGFSGLPIWAKTASSMQQQQDTLTCNVVSLRAKAQPFQWTAVDPDCGLLNASASSTTCKHRQMNFFVMEHGRGGGP